MLTDDFYLLKHTHGHSLLRIWDKLILTEAYQFQNCVLMTIATFHTILSSLSYSAATAIIRYIHVRSSLQVNVQEVIKRNAFIFKSIFIVESVGCFHLYSLFKLQRGKKGVERLPFLVYQTCLDPQSNYTHTIGLTQFKESPFVQFFLIQAANGCIIYFNIYLYKYLDEQAKGNTGKTKSFNKNEYIAL